MADNNQYPSAYKWTAGNNGCRHFNIGKGRAGVVFQVQNTSKKQNKMVAVTPHSLKKMAFLFRLLMGLVPVTPKTYYSNLIYEFYVTKQSAAPIIRRTSRTGISMQTIPLMLRGKPMQSPDSRRSLHCHNSPRGRMIRLQEGITRHLPRCSLRRHPVIIRQTIRIHLQFLMTTVRNQIRSFREQTGLPDGGKTRKRKIKQAGVSASLIKKENMTDGKRSKRRKEQQDCGT